MRWLALWALEKKYALIDTSNEDLYRLIPRRKTPPFFINTSTPSTYVLILFGSRPCIAILHHTFFPSLPKVFKMKRRYTCARLSRSHRTLTRSLLHAAVAPHPHTVAPPRRKPNQGNAPSLTRVVACEQTKLSHPTADT